MDRYKYIRVDGVRIHEHRFVMEKFIGRKLTSNEVVHHKNGNPTDNRISNLEVLSNSEHMKHHSKEFVERGFIGRKTRTSFTSIGNPKKKLSISSVKKIRNSKLSGVELSSIYGISSSHANNLKAGLFWN